MKKISKKHREKMVEHLKFMIKLAPNTKWYGRYMRLVRIKYKIYECF